MSKQYMEEELHGFTYEHICKWMRHHCYSNTCDFTCNDTCACACDMRKSIMGYGQDRKQVKWKIP